MSRHRFAWAWFVGCVLSASVAVAQPGQGPISGGGGGGLPGAGEVTEAMLKVVNACTDEYVLTCETTVGDFEWQPLDLSAYVLLAGDADGQTIQGDSDAGSAFIIIEGNGGSLNTGTLHADSEWFIHARNSEDPGEALFSVLSEEGSASVISATVSNAASATVASVTMDSSGVDIDGLVGWVEIQGVRYGGAVAAAPYTCDGSDPVGYYTDTTGPDLCYCNGSAWAPVDGSGTCA